MVNVSLEAVQKDGESSGDICNMTLWTFPFNFHSITLLALFNRLRKERRFLVLRRDEDCNIYDGIPLTYRGQ